MMSEVVASRVPILTDTSYPEWSPRASAHLISRDLYYGITIVDEDDASEAVRDDQKKFEEWRKEQVAGRDKKKMRLARAEIIRMVDDSQLAHLTSEDPMVMWAELERVHVARGFATRLSLRRQFSRLMKKHDESMNAWLGRVKKLAFRLERSGITVTEEDKILALTNGLPEVYDPLIVALDATPATELTLEYVSNRLINEEVRIEEKVEVEKETALLAKGRGKGTSLSPSVQRWECWGCGEYGHLRRDCKNSKDKDEKVEKSYQVTELQDLGARVVGHIY